MMCDCDARSLKALFFILFVAIGIVGAYIIANPPNVSSLKDNFVLRVKVEHSGYLEEHER